MYALRSSGVTTAQEAGRSLALRPVKSRMASDAVPELDGTATLGESIAVPAENDRARKQQLTSLHSSQEVGGHGELAASEYADAATFVCVPFSMVLRDAIYRMNEVFATNAAVMDNQGHRLGWLTQERIAELFASDADGALQSRCGTLLANAGVFFAA